MENIKKLKKQIETAEERVSQLRSRLEKQYAVIGELYLAKKELETGSEVDLAKLQKDLEEEVEVLREYAKDKAQQEATAQSEQ